MKASVRVRSTSQKKRLHLFEDEGEKASKYFQMATELCAKDAIRVTFEEVVPGSKKFGAHVVDGTDIFGIVMPRQRCFPRQSL